MKHRFRKAALKHTLNNLDQRRWLFANMPMDPTHAEWLRRRAWVRTIHGTTRIEGNTLSDIEVEALLTDAAAGRVTDREAREIIGTREALDLVDELVGQLGMTTPFGPTVMTRTGPTRLA